jgi:hypothetical protein
MWEALSGQVWACVAAGSQLVLTVWGVIASLKEDWAKRHPYMMIGFSHRWDKRLHRNDYAVGAIGSRNLGG